jgi:hypothetical protein
LHRSYKTKAGWSNTNNGRFGLPSFVGSGVIEIVKKGIEPVLSFDIATMSHKPLAEAPKKTVTPPMGGGFVPNIGQPAGFNQFQAGGFANAGANAGAAGDDLPF